MSNFKKVLINDEIEITFLVDEGDARVEFKSNGRYDLMDVDDVVLVVNGKPQTVVPQSDTFAVAQLGSWDDYADSPVSIMTRVGEYFDGWELDL